jgi:hypothetical protein
MAIKSGVPMMEQRKKHRFELHLPYEIQRVPGKAPATGRIRNASSSGVLFACSTRFTLGEKIEYSLTLPRAEWGGADVRVRCFGTVIRADSAKEEFVASVDSYEFFREAVASAAA